MILTCLGIFFARVADVSFGTLRTVYTVKGKQFIAAAIAFVEVFIWFMVAREALSGDLESPIWVAISYAGGYATGTMIGTTISNVFINGLIMLQTIIKKGDRQLVNKIREAGYGVSIVPLEGEVDDIKKEMLFIETSKKNLKKLTKMIKEENPNAFIIVNETKLVQNGLVK